MENIFGIGHDHFMGAAFRQALIAFDEGEVPVGAVIVKDGKIIGRGYNRVEALSDATAHAEIIAITAASESVGDWRLTGCTLYVTLEPCMMCLGAILQSRIDAVVYGTKDPRLGAVDTFPHRQLATESYRVFPEIISGVMEDDSRELLKSFFKKLRQKE